MFTNFSNVYTSKIKKKKKVMALLLIVVDNAVAALVKTVTLVGDGERPYPWLLSSLFGALMCSC